MRRVVLAIVLGAVAFGASTGGCSPGGAAGASPDASSDAASPDAAACTMEQVKCGDQCVVLASDHDNCGTCGAACGDAQACRAATCATCADLNLDTCGTRCADLATDSAHCGACDKACDAGQVCANGRCETDCGDAGMLACGASCVDVQTDDAHCGSCTNACSAGQTCKAAVCECGDPNLVACGAGCSDPRTDSNHCGATAGCGAVAGFLGEKCVANGYCQNSFCQLCETWSQGVKIDIGASIAPLALALQDFNGDGKLDIALLEAATTSKVHMYLGKGDGTFTTGAVANVGAGGARSMRVGDFDGDSRLDIAVANTLPTSARYVTIISGKGDGTFVSGPLIDHVDPAETMATGDINGDGRLDLIIGGGDNTGAADVHTYIQNADHTFARGNTDYSTLFISALGNPYGTMVLADVDKDGKIDLLASADGSPAGAGVFYGDGAGAFTVGWSSSGIGVGGATFLVADVNADGKEDLLVGNQQDLTLTLFAGAGARVFDSGSPLQFPDSRSNLLFDVTGDGILDLVGTEGDAPSTFVVRAGSGESFLPAVSFPFNAGNGGLGMMVGDLNGDGRVDVVGLTGTGIRVLLGAKTAATECP